MKFKEKMTKEDYLYVHNQNNPLSWEALVSNNCKITDLDRDRIQEVVRMAVAKQRMPESALSATIPDILKKLDLVVNDRLINAAVILFCKNERKQFQQANLKLARFKGIDKSEFLDTKYVCANAFDLYDKAMDFLSFALPVAARIEPNNPVRVEEHPSIQRNPRIAHVFYLCGRIEKWGRGTVDMIDDCKKSGNPAPQFEEVGGSFSLTLPLKTPLRTIIYE